MRNRLLGLVALLVAALVCVKGMPAQESLKWKSGAAKINITPDKYIWMSGYGSRDKPADSKLTDLWAKAQVIEDSQGARATIVTLDLVGIDRGLSIQICDELKKHHQLDRARIALSTSHTHTGPAVGRNLGAMLVWRLNDKQLKEIDEYGDTLVRKVTEVVGQAIKNLEPVSLKWGNGNATFAVNRRTNKEPDVPQLRTQGELKGPSDHDVPVLAAYDAEGKLKSVLFGYACHSTVLGTYQWSGDYPAFAMMDLEEIHPGCVALFWAGCGADQNPIPRRTAEHAKHYGRRLSDAVEAVLLTSKMRDVVGNLSVKYREIDLAFDRLPTREQLVTESQSKDNFLASRARILLKQIDSGKPLSQTYPYPISAWTIGDDIQFVALGGEVVVDFAIRLKAELRGPKTWVAGYSHDVMAYIPSRRVLTEGGYEGGGAMVYYGQPTVWAPEVEESIVKEVHSQLK